MILAVPASIKQHRALPRIALISEPFDEPGVGAAACFPNGKMASVGRGNGPAESFFGFLKDCSGFAVQIHIQERRHAGWRRSDNPKTAAIGSPVEACDSGPGLQRENPVLPTGDREKPNVSEPRGEVLLSQSECRAVGRKRPILQIPFRVFNPGEWFLFPRNRIKGEESK